MEKKCTNHGCDKPFWARGYCRACYRKAYRSGSLVIRQSRKNKERRVFDFIVAFKSAHDGLSPTLKEIQEGVGFSSPVSAKIYIDYLVKKGMIRKRGSGTRSGIMVVGGEWVYKEPIK